MAAPGVLERPDVDEGGPSTSGYVVVVYDNDLNTVDEVIEILIEATDCTVEEAEIETWEVHHLGKSVVHHGGEKRCHEVAGIIRTIGIKVEVRQE
jgi:ATP-dependent Clp protease adapter protein ClpS